MDKEQIKELSNEKALIRAKEKIKELPNGEGEITLAVQGGKIIHIKKVCVEKERVG